MTWQRKIYGVCVIFAFLMTFLHFAVPHHHHAQVVCFLKDCPTECFFHHHHSQQTDNEDCQILQLFVDGQKNPNFIGKQVMAPVYSPGIVCGGVVLIAPPMGKSLRPCFHPEAAKTKRRSASPEVRRGPPAEVLA